MSGTSLAAWLRTFRELHERARAGALSPREDAIYRAGRDELARALLAAQRLTLKPGETPRQALRVARALQVDLDVVTDSLRAVTIDVSTGGFSCLLEKPPVQDAEVSYSLRLPGGAPPIVGRCRVASVKPQSGSVRVSFQLVSLDERERDRLETFVFDTVLGQLVA